MEEIGVMSDGKFEERYLCFSPQERLYIHGRWQEGLEPESALTKIDRDQFRRFNDTMKEFRATREFTIPMEIGAKPSPLDQLSFAQWVAQQGFTSPYLRWYADYACRDDYGAHSRDTSAWAGVHYFASREHDEKGPLTWPEGNGWILKRLVAKLENYVRANSLVYRIQPNGRKLDVLTPQVRYVCGRVIYAAPTFTAQYVMDNAPDIRIEYSPWFTANLTLDRLPNEAQSELAWDNVIYDSPSLGYVNATHMSLRSRIDKTVWTFYWALADPSPVDSRRWLLEQNWTALKEKILNDLSRAHPDIRECVSRVDIMRLGHAMARPVPGALFNPARERLAHAKGPIYFANSDVSGFSIFEEAQYRGVKAAESALRSL
jgi:hypothetical protein